MLDPEKREETSEQKVNTIRTLQDYRNNCNSVTIHEQYFDDSLKKILTVQEENLLRTYIEAMLNAKTKTIEKDIKARLV